MPNPYIHGQGVYYQLNNNIVINFCINLFCINWCDMIKLLELNISWPTWYIFIILHFYSTNELMTNKFIQDKFV